MPRIWQTSLDSGTIFAFSGQKFIRKRRVSFIQPNIYQFCCFFFTSDLPGSFWLRNFVVTFLGQICWWQILLFLPSSKTVFTLSSFLKVIFTGFGILGWQLFQCLKHVILGFFFFFLVSIVSTEKSVVVWMPQSYSLMSRVLSFFLVFSDWIMICLGLYFFGLIWGSCSFLSLESWASWIHLCVSPNLRDFTPNFIKYLCVPSSHLVVSNSLWPHVL